MKTQIGFYFSACWETRTLFVDADVPLFLCFLFISGELTNCASIAS